MADKPTGTEKDSGHRVYMQSEDYMTAMKRVTDKHFDNSIKRPHSDDKKPYMDDEYPEMEHFFTPYTPPPWTPVVPPIVPDPPPPFHPDIPPPDAPPEDGTSHTVFWCEDPDGCFRKGDTTEIHLNCGYPVVGVEFFMFTPDGIEISTSGNKMIVTAAEGEASDDRFNFNILMRGPNPDGIIQDGIHWNKSLSACDCEEVVELEWEADNPPSNMNDNTSEYISVLYGEPPFNWEVEGDGFSFTLEQTTGRTNELNLANNKCGVGKVTVNGSCGTVVGYVLSNYGSHWAPAFFGGCICKIEGTVVGYVDDFKWSSTFGGSYCGGDADSCMKHPSLGWLCTGGYSNCSELCENAGYDWANPGGGACDEVSVYQGYMRWWQWECE